VSGQSLRYQIRRKFEEMGETLSPISSSEKTEGVDVTAGDPHKYIDDDLLGFMIASQNENRRRTAPIRTSASVGLFPFRGDRDMGTKSKESTSGEMAAGGNIFETEEYYNFFRTNLLIEVDRVGVFRPFELQKNDKKEDLDRDARKQRIEKLFKALTVIWGGGKQSRMLTDMSPKFIVITFQYAKNPIFLEGLSMNKDEKIETSTIKEILSDNNNIIASTFIGFRTGIFKNDFEKDLNGHSVLPVNATIEKAIEYLKTMETI
jgi:CRISPR-associated protein Cst2